MKKVLLDTNILMDIVLERVPYDALALKIMEFIANQQITAYISAITLININYIVKKVKGKDLALKFIAEILDVFEITDANKTVLKNALMSNFPDFENAAQNFSAIDAGIEIIVTRNKKDFQQSKLQIYTPSEFIEYIEKEQ